MSQPPQPYPDVLGMLADERMTVGDVFQCAVGVFPTATALDKPLELLLLMQNMTDQPLAVRLMIRTPVRNKQGDLLNFFTPKPRLGMTLPAGDCGLLHIPVTPQLPPPAGQRYGARVAVAVEKPAAFAPVRPVAGGEPARHLSISDTRLTVLRDITFAARQPAEGQLSAVFEVLPGEVAPGSEVPQPRYEALWTAKELAQESEQVQAVAGEALRFVRGLDRSRVHTRLLDLTQQAYIEAGQPLHPGEVIFITKPLAYAAADGLDLEAGFSLASGRWFQRLCRLMVDDTGVINDLDALLEQLYPAIVYDATRLSFSMVAQSTGTDFGDATEQAEYAARLSAALEGADQAALEHIYVPLAMAGVLLNARITLSNENPWTSLDALKEALEGRVSLVGSGFREVFDILTGLIEEAEQLLREMRIPRE